ncbi:trimeric intracellular cation channel family protein [Anaeromyxobacter terrae]|uniref:trimeric intracellular cation channel family protein n=1 Tax=Anaeromyxobacter terrae TaxID=2925406 RepID=UPI001F580EC7|nr:trimeric intracellular cation channel family protein [Anaeromyxobacter sp. SG22]
MTVTRFAVDLGVLPVALDLGGTFVFALSGAAAGVKHRLDVFGALVLALVAASSGGMVRDVLIGAVPPAALVDWRYLAVSLLAGAVVLLWHSAVERLRNPVQLFDAVGLALFAVSGAHKALAFHVGPLPAALLGMLSGIGGGIVRDLLVAEVPTVLRAEIYAVAALAGAAVVVLGSALGVPSSLATAAGALLCFGLRFMALRRGWRLPVAGEQEPSADAAKTRWRA